MGSKETQEYIHNHNLALKQDEGHKVKLHSTEAVRGEVKTAWDVALCSLESSSTLKM
jgi:hypothetical protein